MQKGFFPVLREDMQNKALFSTPEEKLAWLYLLEHAAFRPHPQRINGVLVEIGYGELVESLRDLTTAFGFNSTTKTRNWLKLLQEYGKIEHSKTKNLTHLTVCFLRDYYISQHTENTLKTHSKHTQNTLGTHSEHTPYIEKGKKGKKEKKGEVSAAAENHFELTEKIGKKAADMWINDNLGELLNGKGNLALGWLRYRCEIQRPIMAHAEMSELVRIVQATEKGRLAKMMKHSIAGRYPALYTDFDQKGSNAAQAAQYPNDWYVGIEQKMKYSPQQTIEYYKHLKANGWEKQTHQGKAFWKKIT